MTKGNKSAGPDEGSASDKIKALIKHDPAARHWLTGKGKRPPNDTFYGPYETYSPACGRAIRPAKDLP